MKQIKRFFSIFMVIAIIIAMTAACGGKAEEPAEPDQTATEAEDVADETENKAADEDTANVEEPAENATEDTEMTEEQKAAQANREEIQRYNEEVLGMKTEETYDPAANLGLPEEKLQELYTAIENAVKEEYLAKYNINPNIFEWPGKEGGKGDPMPWMYLNAKVDEKLLNPSEEPEMDLSKYELTDSQTVELMDCVYRQIIAWIQNNGYSDFMISIKWHEIVLQHVVIE